MFEGRDLSLARVLPWTPWILVFVLSNAFGEELLFLGVLLPLALAWGWLAQKTGSIWGSVLFHAGMDISVMVGIFSRLAGP